MATTAIGDVVSYESILAGVAELQARERDYSALELRVMSGMERNNIRLDDEYRRQLTTGRRADWIIMDEVSAFPERPRDDYLDATRYALIYGQAAVRQRFAMATIDTTHYGPSLTATISTEVGRIDGIQNTEAPKEEKMNELMTALEAMIRE